METKVIFRKYNDGEIIALFPETITHNSYLVDCFTLVEGHSRAYYQGTIKVTRLAEEKEYKYLYSILENRGYKLKVMKRAKIRLH